jgi:hypothetical protein
MVKRYDPFNYRSKYKTAFAYSDARQRYLFSTYSTSTPTFKTYDLAVDGLLSTGTYTGTKGIDRVLYSKQNAPYLIGIELEIEGCDGYKGYEKTDRVATVLRKYLPENHVCVPDGSVRDGLEIVTAPLTPNEVSRVAWYGLLRELSRAGCTSHETGRCGLHVSISRKYLTDQGWRRLRAFLTKQRAFFSAISRRDGNHYYCEFSNQTTKYTALNLSKTPVAEFRFFRGTLKPSSFIASVETVRALVEWVHGLEVQGKTRLTVAGFLKTLNQPRFKVARDYIGARVELLKTPTAATRRPRRSVEDRRRDAVARFVAYNNPFGAMLTTNPQADQLFLELSNRGFLADNLSIDYSTDPRVQSLPIDWENSVLPTTIREQVARGWFPSVVAVKTRYAVPADQVCVRFHYTQGGWGRCARISTRVVRVNSARH